MNTTTSNLSSVILTPFQVVMYVEGMENRVTASDRLSVIRWKTPKDKMSDTSYRKQPTLCVAIPVIEFEVEPACLVEAMKQAIEDMQDNAIRDVITTEIEAQPGMNLATILIPRELGTPSGLAAWSAKKVISGRLSTELLTQWFASTLQAPLEVALAGIEGISEVQHTKAVAQHKMLVISLASPRAVMNPKIAAQLQKAINLVPVGDKVRNQLNTKLELFINPVSANELLLSL